MDQLIQRPTIQLRLNGILKLHVNLVTLALLGLCHRTIALTPHQQISGRPLIHLVHLAPIPTLHKLTATMSGRRWLTSVPTQHPSSPEG
jgi:hypothetical protein